MDAGRAVARYGVNAALAALAVVSALVPIGSEVIHPEPVPLSSAVFLAKGAVIAALLGLTFVALMRRGRRIGGLPLFRVGLLTAAATATGLTAFDLCNRAHSVIAASDCHCWTTAWLTAIATVVAVAGVLWGRVVAAFTRRLVRRIRALLVFVAAGAEPPLSAQWLSAAPFRRSTPLARRLAGRAPPTSA